MEYRSERVMTRMEEGGENDPNSRALCTLCYGTDNASGAVPWYTAGCRVHTDDALGSHSVAGMKELGNCFNKQGSAPPSTSTACKD